MSITRRTLFGLAAAAPALLLPRRSQAQDSIPEIAKGPYNGAESLKQYRIPEWFRDYKFGMWAHWGPQSAAEFGDWYARNMYMQDSPQNKYHVEIYGHPSKVGFKDVALTWHGTRFRRRPPDPALQKGRRQILHVDGRAPRQLRSLELQAPAALERRGHRPEEGYRRPVRRRGPQERPEVRRQRASLQQLQLARR